MPMEIPHNRRQQKIALKRQLVDAGIWPQFVQARERLKSGGISGAEAWDLLAPLFAEILEEVAAGAA